MTPKFEIKKSTNNQYYFNLKAGNGEIILTSETYTTKQNCINGISSVKNNSSIDDRYKRYRKTRNNIEYYYFILEASNGEPIGNSEMYTSRSGRENGIDSVKNNASVSSVYDLS